MWKKRTKIFSRFVILFCITSSVGIKKRLSQCARCSQSWYVTTGTLHFTWPVFMWRAPGAAAFPTHVSCCCIRPLWTIKNTHADANKQTHSFPYWLVTSDMFFIRSLYVLYLGEEIHIWSVRYIFSFIFRWCIIEISIHTEHLWALTICLKHRNTVETLDCWDAAWAVGWWLQSERERDLPCKQPSAISQINILFW